MMKFRISKSWQEHTEFMIEEKYNRAIRQVKRDFKKLQIWVIGMLLLFVGLIGLLIYLTIISRTTLAILLGVVIIGASLTIINLYIKENKSCELMVDALKDAYEDELSRFRVFCERQADLEQNVQEQAVQDEPSEQQTVSRSRFGVGAKED